MRLPSFVKLPRHKKFDFQPRFYDEDKEQREVARMTIEKGRINSYSSSNLLGAFRSYKMVNRERQNSSSKYRKLILLSGLCAVTGAYYYFELNGLISMGLILIFLVLFIRETNKL